MIETHTVFVLGAGASQPYGYPIGRQLTEQVLKGLSAGQALWETLRSTDFTEDHLSEFSSALQNSGRYSVDAFLQYRPEFLAVGKAAMAYELILHETLGGLPEADSRHDWYRHLLHKMDAPPEEFGQNSVSFITFNYDRSLEHYLFVAVKNMFGLDGRKAAGILRNFQFLHLHGDLGLLPWQGSEDTREYYPEPYPEHLRLAIKRMNIIHDDIAPRKDVFAYAQALLKTAGRVIFLGFGYDPINVERLGLEKIPYFQAVGTAQGFLDGEVDAIQTLTQNKIQLENCDCLVLLRRFCKLT